MSSDVAQGQREPLPQERDALLERAGPGRTKIYELVRQILDELEAAAPWKDLYYPPEDAADLAAMEVSLLRIIDATPLRVRALEEDLGGMGPEEATEQLLEEARFFFDVIHASVEPEIAVLRSKIEAASRAASAGTSGTIALTSDDRDALCELTADLKGKYSSSIMGVAASLVLKDLGGGPAAESILFAEKAEELERNRLLVETLSEVIENITSLLREVPLAELVEQWAQEQRVDLYALTPLYQLLGNLGKLMKEESRRAIYPGDYHQIRKRERLLDARINELSVLHNAGWEADSKPFLLDSSYFSLMIQKATELAAILDLNILKMIAGEDNVEKLLALAAHEKESAPATAGPRSSAPLAPVPRHLQPLIPLLHTEDLQTFLGLLLGSVLKRASLSREREARAAVAQSLGELQKVLETLLSRSNVHRMAYALVYRLLKEGKVIPREMLQSMLPYVHEVRHRLIPLLQAPHRPAAVAASHAADLLDGCTFLCQKELTPDQLRERAPGVMEEMLRRLDELDTAVRAARRADTPRGR